MNRTKSSSRHTREYTITNVRHWEKKTETNLTNRMYILFICRLSSSKLYFYVCFRCFSLLLVFLLFKFAINKIQSEFFFGFFNFCCILNCYFIYLFLFSFFFVGFVLFTTPLKGIHQQYIRLRVVSEAHIQRHYQ